MRKAMYEFFTHMEFDSIMGRSEKTSKHPHCPHPIAIQHVDARYNFDMGAVYTNFLQMIADDQSPSGNVPIYVPNDGQCAGPGLCIIVLASFRLMFLLDVTIWHSTRIMDITYTHTHTHTHTRTCTHEGVLTWRFTASSSHGVNHQLHQTPNKLRNLQHKGVLVPGSMRGART